MIAEFLEVGDIVEANQNIQFVIPKGTIGIVEERSIPGFHDYCTVAWEHGDTATFSSPVRECTITVIA